MDLIAHTQLLQHSMISSGYAPSMHGLQMLVHDHSVLMLLAHRISQPLIPA